VLRREDAAPRQLQIRAAHSTADRRGGLRTRRECVSAIEAGRERAGPGLSSPGAYGKEFAPDWKFSARSRFCRIRK
jgi:hypothetical protein